MRSVTVTGHGRASAVPDQARVRLAAVHRADSIREALAGVESARALLIATAGDLVVASVDLNVWPVHDQDGRQSGFEARHSFTVTGADLEVAGDLLGRLGDEAGDRVQVESVALSVGDPTAAMRAAREAAYADARLRAEHLAGLAGTALGEVQSVSEGFGPPMPLVHEAAMFASASKVDVTLQPGVTTLDLALTVTWALA